MGGLPASSRQVTLSRAWRESPVPLPGFLEVAMRDSVAAGRVLSILFFAAALPALAQSPFDAVFAIMTQDAGPDSPGCRGCHVGPQESPPAPWWGDTQQDVLASIEASGLVIGGRMSYLGYRLQQGEMPLGGRPWNSDEIDILNSW